MRTVITAASAFFEKVVVGMAEPEAVQGQSLLLLTRCKVVEMTSEMLEDILSSEMGSYDSHYFWKIHYLVEQ